MIGLVQHLRDLPPGPSHGERQWAVEWEEAAAAVELDRVEQELAALIDDYTAARLLWRARPVTRMRWGEGKGRVGR